MHKGSIFSNIPATVPDELFEMLAGNGDCRIERIISDGHASPSGFWYDQEENEWVMVIRGAATLAYADGTVLRLNPGDWTDIPRHVRHRVEHTAPGTVWLAVHYRHEETGGV